MSQKMKKVEIKTCLGLKTYWLWNGVLVLPEDKKYMKQEEWYSPEALEQLREVFENLSPRVRAAMLR